MRLANFLLVALLGVLATATPLFAAEGSGPYVGIGAGIGMGLAIIGIGVGIGIVGYAALGGIARQPEQAGAIQGAMFILAGLIEGAGIIALVLCLALVFL
ncbi:ATP synthase F0 subunit C [Gemmata sp.]|uniref:ATP synthase F0 subunit C n=1 Tax=Gemmata sp. TaxID=1914242 RepID=UPI003F6EC171